MKKVLRVVFCAVLLSSYSPNPSYAAAKAGATCKKLNQIQKVQQIQLKCVKSGSKLRWILVEAKKTQSIPAVVTETSNENLELKVGDVCSTGYKGSTKATSKATLRCKVANDGTLRWLDDLGVIADPTPLKAPVVIPKSFEELLGNGEGSATAAWNSVNKKITNSEAVPVRVDLHVGPNTRLLNLRTSDAFERATRVFNGFKQPKSFVAIYYKFQDLEWAQNKADELRLPSRVRDEIRSSCSEINKCNGASAGKAGDDSGFVQSTVGSLDRTMLTGGLEMHEYAHIVQAMQFIGKPTDNFNFRYLPTWLLEGHAHVVGITGSATSLEDYLENRKSWLNDYPKKGRGTFSTQDVEDFYESLMPGKTDPEMQPYVYSIGFITLEYLVALKGVDSPMELIINITDGYTFEESFAKIYGIEWKAAKSLLAKAIHKEFFKG
jgi:hypothetical protein